MSDPTQPPTGDEPQVPGSYPPPPPPPAGATPPPGAPIPPTGGAVPPPPPPGAPIPPTGGAVPPPPPPPTYGMAPVPGMAPNGRVYAEWIWRVLAYIVDYIPFFILYVLGWIARAIFTTTDEVLHTASIGGTTYSYTTRETSTSAFGLLVWFLLLAVGVIYLFWNKGYKEGTTGKSIGKQMTGYTTVKEETGEPLGAAMGCARLVLLWVDFAICYVGVLWPLWDAKRQCLISDKVTGAVVYKD